MLMNDKSLGIKESTVKKESHCIKIEDDLRVFINSIGAMGLSEQER